MTGTPLPRAATTLARALAVTVACALLLAGAQPAPSSAQASTTVVGGPGSANYRLAARFAPYKLDDLIHSPSVDPRWIEGSERFWYEFETSEGKEYVIVDPARGAKRPIFDNARLAAELTRITGDPYDAQHLPIREIRFLDGSTLEFEVESSLDEEGEDDDGMLGEEVDTLGIRQQEEGERRGGREETKKKVHHFRYDVDTQALRELEDWEAPDDHPDWASVSPDGRTVVFARNHDLHMMSAGEYARILVRPAPARRRHPVERGPDRAAEGATENALTGRATGPGTTYSVRPSTDSSRSSRISSPSPVVRYSAPSRVNTSVMVVMVSRGSSVSSSRHRSSVRTFRTAWSSRTSWKSQDGGW